jgi:hypothetical protein
MVSSVQLPETDWALYHFYPSPQLLPGNLEVLHQERRGGGCPWENLVPAATSEETHLLPGKHFSIAGRAKTIPGHNGSRSFL